MKLYAQCGAGEGQKIFEGFDNDLIDGVIASPKDAPLSRLLENFQTYQRDFPKKDRLFDPQFYACFLAQDFNSRLGNLADDYSPYFGPRRRSQLESEENVRKDIEFALEFQRHLPVTALIAPNIYIPRSFNSIEAAISKDFIRLTRQTYKKFDDPRPIYATLAISRSVLLDKRELEFFLNDLTLMEHSPDGFYLLIGANSAAARAEIFNADTIGGWLLLNHVLKLNDFNVINGFSDTVSPFLGAAGADAGAFGWSSNLRTFSLERFGPPSSGGRLPVQRYLSCSLLNRIRFDELERLRYSVPGILNVMTTDDLYDDGEGSQPQRNQEVLQSWDAVKALIARASGKNTPSALKKCLALIEDAKQAYMAVNSRMLLDPKSNDDHLNPLSEGIQLFAELAELDLT
jgi:hypothetical protein